MADDRWRYNLTDELPHGVVEVAVYYGFDYRRVIKLARLSAVDYCIMGGKEDPDRYYSYRYWQVVDDNGKPVQQLGGVNVTIRQSGVVYAWRPQQPVGLPSLPEDIRHITDDLIEKTDYVYPDRPGRK